MDKTLRSLRLLRTEAVITAMIVSMPIMNPFFASLGMDQGQIGLSQAVFTMALLTLNIPTGWLADRFSRKACNAVGDCLVAIGFLGYSQAQTFTHVVFAEIIIGVGLAFTDGADAALLEAYCRQLKRSLTQENARIACWRPIAEIAAVTLGGFIGANHPRTAIALTAVPFVIGTLLSLKISEAGERMERTHPNPFKEMGAIMHHSLRINHRLKWLILAHAIGREITHPLIWVLTPLLLLAGVPAAVVGVGWALNLAAASIGARLAHAFAERLPEWLRFSLPMAIVIGSLLVLCVEVSLLTIWLYANLGLVRGWMFSVTRPMIQAHTPGSQQATVLSIATSISNLFYIPAVWGINAIGTYDIRYTLLATIVVFTPFVLVVGCKLYRHEQQQERR